MKTFIVIFSFLLTAMSGAFAQGNKTIECFSEPVTGVRLSCLNEQISGELEVCMIFFDSEKYQLKSSGKFIGLTTGSIYTIREIQNENIHNYVYDSDGPANLTWLSNGVIKKDGKLVCRIKYLTHITINANGEITADVLIETFKCY